MLGALWEVDDTVAQAAIEFWQRAADKRKSEPVAPSCDLRAKYNANSNAPVTTYLAYVYYGHPRLTLSHPTLRRKSHVHTIDWFFTSDFTWRRLRCTGVQGSAALKHPHRSDDRRRSRSADDGKERLTTTLRAANITGVRQMDLTLKPTKPDDATRSLRSVDGQEMLELHVPDLGPDCGQLVLACNETGVLTWHLPIDDKQQVQPPASRGSGGVKRFLIPATQPKPAPVGAGQRALGVFEETVKNIGVPRA